MDELMVDGRLINWKSFPSQTACTFYQLHWKWVYLSTMEYVPYPDNRTNNDTFVCARHYLDGISSHDTFSVGKVL